MYSRLTDGETALANLEQGKAARNSKGTGTSFAVKKACRQRPFAVGHGVQRTRDLTKYERGE